MTELTSDTFLRTMEGLFASMPPLADRMYVFPADLKKTNPELARAVAMNPDAYWSEYATEAISFPKPKVFLYEPFRPVYVAPPSEGISFPRDYWQPQEPLDIVGPMLREITIDALDSCFWAVEAQKMIQDGRLRRFKFIDGYQWAIRIAPGHYRKLPTIEPDPPKERTSE